MDLNTLKPQVRGSHKTSRQDLKHKSKSTGMKSKHDGTSVRATNLQGNGIQYNNFVIPQATFAGSTS